MTSISNSHNVRCHHHDRVQVVAETIDEPVSAPSIGSEILAITGVSKTFRQKGHKVPALVGVNLSLADGETLGLVGESGSGKSTLAKAILGVHAADGGSSIALDQHELASSIGKRSSNDKRALQIIFQNPDSALNASWTVRRILARSVRKLTGMNAADADAKVATLADTLRLSPRHLDMKPSQLSGGLKQRVAIARAFAGDPRIVVCDEPTSALDVSVQGAILNLLSELQAQRRTSYVFISHDLGVVRYLADRIAVMYLGRIMEVGDTDQVFNGPHHPYTEALLSAVPSVDGAPRERIPLVGEIPSPANPPSGCVFHTRCPRAIEGLCASTEPPMVEDEEGHQIRCHIPISELATLQLTAAPRTKRN
jgi:peptide/nickel transport system ATP-binding protein